MRFLALVFGGRAGHVLVHAALLAGMTRLDALPHHGLTLLARYLVGFASVDKWRALVSTRGAALHRHQRGTQLQPSEPRSEHMHYSVNVSVFGWRFWVLNASPYDVSDQANTCTSVRYCVPLFLYS